MDSRREAVEVPRRTDGRSAARVNGVARRRWQERGFESIRLVDALGAGGRDVVPFCLSLYLALALALSLPLFPFFLFLFLLSSLVLLFCLWWGLEALLLLLLL